MSLRDRLLEFEDRLKRLAGEASPREPLEIRQAVLQGIVDLTRPAGRARRVLPFDRIDVDVLAPSAALRRVFDAVFARDDGLEACARKALAGVGCDPGAQLSIALRYRRQPPRGWPTDQVFALTGHADERPSAAAAAAAAPRAGADVTTPRVVLKVLAGIAARKKVELRAERINIGRQPEVSDRDQRLVRRNHLVFSEGDEVSSTVSRAHAHVRYDRANGEFRLRDDNSAYGTRIVRDGRTIEVAAGNSRGAKLRPGDELHFGRAVVLFDVEA